MSKTKHSQISSSLIGISELVIQGESRYKRALALFPLFENTSYLWRRREIQKVICAEPTWKTVILSNIFSLVRFSLTAASIYSDAAS